MNNHILIISLIVVIIFFGCNDNVDFEYNHNPNYVVHPDTKYIFYDDYPDYYENYYQFEFVENTKLIVGTKILNLMLKNNENLIGLHKINQDFDDFPEINTLTVVNQIGRNRSLKFYKYQMYFNLDTSAWLINYEYPIDTTLRKKIKIFELHYEYPNPNPDTLYKSCYIEWSSKQANVFDKHPELQSWRPEFMWGINKTTDTIQTNLSRESIMTLYPDFNGVYIFKKYSKIEVDYSYQIKDSSFFNHIKFIE